MGGIVKKKKKTLFGWVVRKIESELTPREEKWSSPGVPLGGIHANDDTAIIESRRDELKASKHDNSDVVVKL